MVECHFPFSRIAFSPRLTRMSSSYHPTSLITQPVPRIKSFGYECRGLGCKLQDIAQVALLYMALHNAQTSMEMKEQSYDQLITRCRIIAHPWALLIEYAAYAVDDKGVPNPPPLLFFQVPGDGISLEFHSLHQSLHSCFTSKARVAAWRYASFSLSRYMRDLRAAHRREWTVTRSLALLLATEEEVALSEYFLDSP